VPTPREQLASILKQSRLDAGFESHGTLAKRLSVSRPVVSKAENPAQPAPSDPLLAAWAGATGVGLDQLADLAQRCKSGTPDWFIPYRQAEAEATTIRCWAPMVLPGGVREGVRGKTGSGVSPGLGLSAQRLVVCAWLWRWPGRGRVGAAGGGSRDGGQGAPSVPARRLRCRRGLGGCGRGPWSLVLPPVFWLAPWWPASPALGSGGGLQGRAGGPAGVHHGAGPLLGVGHGVHVGAQRHRRVGVA
jgi:transcriptional regulator with XRE-family HTH domain